MLDVLALRRGFKLNLPYRLVVRSAFVLFVAFVSCLLPFFGSIMGLLGAISITPTTYFMPCILWMVLRKPPRSHWSWWFCVVAVPALVAVMILGSIGAVRDIVLAASNFGVFP